MVGKTAKLKINYLADCFLAGTTGTHLYES